MKVHIHPAFESAITHLQSSPPQALLLSGQPGIGLSTVAKHIAGARAAHIIAPNSLRKGSTAIISIDAIRELYELTRSKHTKRQVIIIDDAETMGRGAQAAFLKLLEEPNTTTYFILTSHHPELLLPTIQSRVQQYTLPPVTSSQTTTILDELSITDATKKQQLQFLAGGLPAELYRLATNDIYFAEKVTFVTDARQFLQGSSYQALKITHHYRSDRPKTLHMLDMCLVLLRHSLSKTPEPSNITKLQELLLARDAIAANQNVALVLARYVL